MMHVTCTIGRASVADDRTPAVVAAISAGVAAFAVVNLLVLSSRR